MGINAQIGWSEKAKLLVQVSKQVNKAIKVASSINKIITTTTTTTV